MNAMILRPHHILDILSTYGAEGLFEPAASGSAVHIAAKLILGDMDTPILLHAGVDDICRPCKNLIDGKRCSNVLTQLDPPISMQDYNDRLDERLLETMGIPPDAEMTAGVFFNIVASKMTCIVKICTHPGEDEENKQANLCAGLVRLALAEHG